MTKVALYPRRTSDALRPPSTGASKAIPPPAPAPEAPPAAAPEAPRPAPVSLLDGIEIRASADETGNVVENTTLPQYHFRIWVEGSPAALGRVKSVQYEFDHPTFRDKVQRSSDRRNRFEQGYRGWG